MSGDENRRQLSERARQAGLAVAAERERRAAEPERPLAPGDLFVDRRTAELPVEWAVIGEERARGGGEAGAGDAAGGTVTAAGKADELTRVAGAPAGKAGKKDRDAGAAGESAGARESSVTAAARLLVVPADSFPLRGPADVAVAAGSPAGPLTLRCAHGIWIESARLTPAAPPARLPDHAVAEARERHRTAGDAEAGGEPFGTPLEREAAIDPEYRHWVESVLVPARRAMAAAGVGVAPAGDGSTGGAPAGDVAATEPPAPDEPPRPVSLAERRRRGSRPPVLWALAASVLLLVALGLFAGMLRQRHEVAELRAAERRLSEQLAELSTEKTALRAERERLERRLTGLDEEHRRELAERESAAEAAERGLRDRIAALGRQLSEALGPRVWTDPIPRLPTYEPVRGADPKVLELPAGAARIALLLEHDTSDGRDRYRLELYRDGDQRPVWTAEDALLQQDLFGFFVELPTELLEPGEYRWKLYRAGEGGAWKLVAEYEMEVVREGVTAP